MLGRLVRDPEVKYTQGSKPTCVARYTLAVPRKFKQQDGQDADFVKCIAFGKNGEFAEKYLKQGIKISISGRIQTGSYEPKNGPKVYTTDIVVEEQEFAESKAASESAAAVSHPQNEPQQMSFQTEPQPQPQQTQKSQEQPWMKIPDGYEDNLPFL